MAWRDRIHDAGPARYLKPQFELAKLAQNADQTVQSWGFAVARKQLHFFWVACEASTLENLA